MVTEDTDVEELLELVISVGKRVQENSKVLDTMSEIVKKVHDILVKYLKFKMFYRNLKLSTGHRNGDSRFTTRI